MDDRSYEQPGQLIILYHTPGAAGDLKACWTYQSRISYYKKFIKQAAVLHVNRHPSYSAKWLICSRYMSPKTLNLRTTTVGRHLTTLITTLCSSFMASPTMAVRLPPVLCIQFVDFDDSTYLGNRYLCSYARASEQLGTPNHSSKPTPLSRIYTVHEGGSRCSRTKPLHRTHYEGISEAGGISPSVRQ